MMRKVSFILSFFLSISYSIVNSQTIQQIGYYNDNGIVSMSSETNFVILGNGSVIDISNPSSPNLFGSVSLPGFNTSVLASGNYSYFGSGMTEILTIADISNPGFPLKIGSRIFSSTAGGIFGISKSSNILCLANGGDGVYTMDVSNPANPIVLDSVAISSGQARDIVTHGSFAYVAHTDGLKVINISNPANINIISTIGSGYFSIDIDTIHNLVFLGKGSGGIDVFNIANPYLPIPAFAIPNSCDTAWDVKYRNNLVYLATNNCGLFIYKIIGSLGVQMANFSNQINGQSFAVSLQDSLILLAGLINGVAILKYDSLGVAGIVDEKDFNQITISPNPATNYVEFNVKSASISEIEIINSIGESVFKENCTNTKNRIDISNLTRGNYIISFKNKKRSWSKKLIKSE